LAIYAWFGTSPGGKVPDPDNHVIDRIGKELIKAGYADEHTKVVCLGTRDEFV